MVDDKITKMVHFCGGFQIFKSLSLPFGILVSPVVRNLLFVKNFLATCSPTPNLVREGRAGREGRTGGSVGDGLAAASVLSVLPPCTLASICISPTRFLIMLSRTLTRSPVLSQEAWNTAKERIWQAMQTVAVDCRGGTPGDRAASPEAKEVRAAQLMCRSPLKTPSLDGCPLGDGWLCSLTRDCQLLVLHPSMGGVPVMGAGAK
jgi:hypothetical protein